MRSPALAVLLVVLLAVTAAPSRPIRATTTSVKFDTTCKYPDAVYYGDTLKVIWKPLATLPALVRPGDTLTVWANAPDVPTNWSASLQFAGVGVPLTAATGVYRADLGRWILGFQIPPGVPEELFALILNSDTGISDTTRHSVKVLPDFRTDYYFAQISDTHLPEHTFSSSGAFSTCDTSGMADFDAVIADLNLIHPEFILHTGDLVNEGDLDTLYQMNEMSRALQMVYRLRDPMFLSSGNHDIGGFSTTPVPAGTSRRDWWRYFGWPSLANPPAGDPYHSQDYSFDYGPLHVIALESYLNYDSWMAGIWGGGSFTSEQLSWLNQDIAAAGSKHKLLMYHFDFDQGSNTGNTSGPWQLNIASLGVDGAIWGHDHVVPENTKTAFTAHPFDLGLQSVISNASGGRTFRIFRVHDGNISPGPMHHAGTTTDSLSEAWSGPNDGTRSVLSATITNRFGEAWEHARLVFNMVDHDSAYGATGGSVAQTIRGNGVSIVYVDCTLPASGAITVSLAPIGALGVPGAHAGLALEDPTPNPFQPGAGRLKLAFELPRQEVVSVDLFDAAGRRVVELWRGSLAAGRHEISWDGLTGGGTPATSGAYFVRLEAGGSALRKRVLLLR